MTEPNRPPVQPAYMQRKEKIEYTDNVSFFGDFFKTKIDSFDLIFRTCSTVRSCPGLIVRSELSIAVLEIISRNNRVIND